MLVLGATIGHFKQEKVCSVAYCTHCNLQCSNTKLGNMYNSKHNALMWLLGTEVPKQKHVNIPYSKKSDDVQKTEARSVGIS